MKPYHALDAPSPRAYRLLLRFGRPLGLRWIPDNWLGVVYRMGNYHDMRGPGFFWINCFTEAVKNVISIEPDSISITVPSIQTRDGLRLDMRICLTYVFDPRSLPRDEAAILVKRFRVFHRLIVSEAAKIELRSILSQFCAEEVCRGEAFELIERDLKSELPTYLGKVLRPEVIRPPVFVQVLEVVVPLELQDRFPKVIKRDDDLSRELARYESFEFDDAKRQELFREVRREIRGDLPYLSNILDEDALPLESTVNTEPSTQKRRRASRLRWPTSRGTDGGEVSSQSQDGH